MTVNWRASFIELWTSRNVERAIENRLMVPHSSSDQSDPASFVGTLNRSSMAESHA